MGRRVAQAQAQQQAEITFTESLEVSIFHVSHLRGLFPSHLFKTVDMPNLGGLQIMMLKPDTPESRLLVDWVEGGVYDALKQKYLKCLLFGISEDERGSRLMEEYVYKFNYDNDGGVTVNVSTNGKAMDRHRGNKKKQKASVSSVKYQVCRLIRMLVHICKTLDSMPAERYLFMKLTYHEDTPDEYEPPHFKPITEEGLGHFARKPFSMNLGDVCTNHHAVSLRVKSLLDSCNEGLDEHENSDQSSTQVDDEDEAASVMQGGEHGDEQHNKILKPEVKVSQQKDEVEADMELGMDGDVASIQTKPKEAEQTLLTSMQAEQTSPIKPNPKDRLAGDLQDLMTAPQGQSEPAYMDAMPLAPGPDALLGTAPDVTFSEDAAAKYDAVMAYCLSKGQVLFTTLMTEFVSIHLGDLERFLHQMVQEGLLEPTESKDAYKVVQQSATACALSTAGFDSTKGADRSEAGMEESENQTCQQQQQHQHQHVTNQLGNLSMHNDCSEQKSGVAAVNSRKRSADDSQAARVSYKGSAATNSAAAGLSTALSVNGDAFSCKDQKEQVPDSQPNLAYFESQQSFDNPRAKPKKASFVEKPIHQSKKQRTDSKAVPARQTRAMAKQDGSKSRFQMMQ
ncbi:hypothetical protein ABBQ32_002477 [Trebouxia sp. C0010 RCD-2024]